MPEDTGSFRLPDRYLAVGDISAIIPVEPRPGAVLNRSDPVCPELVRSTPDRFSDIACELLCRGQEIRFTAPGMSMQPTIRDGEIVHVEPIRLDQICCGDILLYRWQRGVRAHRVTKIENAEPSRLFYILRGDAGVDDERIPGENVFGRVISLERDGRQIRLRGSAAFTRRIFRLGASRIRAMAKSQAAR